jgi:hypothetical protein
MQKKEGSRRLGKQHQAKEAADSTEMGPGRSAQAGQPSPFRGLVAPLDLATIRTIYSPETKSHTSIHWSSAAEEQRSLRDTILERRVVQVV